jgi:arsenate reductase
MIAIGKGAAMSNAPSTPRNVLFLCTGNSARSILSEALLNDLGEGRFMAFSAGSKPSGVPHPDALAELQRRGHAVDRYRSKSWDEFSNAGAPEIDIVVTVCGSAAAETCPVFFGSGLRVHWGAPDPAYIDDDAERVQAFSDVYELCRQRVEALIALSDAALTDQAALQAIAP